MPHDLLRSIHGPQDLKKLSIDQLTQVADELRGMILDQITRTGGHFASNLGVIELTIALHYVYDFAYDRLIFDVGHQCYPHKLLTGRQDLFPNLKQKGGMAGFPEPRESEYDLFSVGHAGTSISCATGLAMGDHMKGEDDRHVVNVIGDSSIVNGLAMEGLNFAGTLKRQFLTVLNDNGRAIGDPQGAMAQYFDRVRVSHTLGDIKKAAKNVLDRIPGGGVLEEVYHAGGRILKTAIATDHMFEHFGHVCIGPVDGHDLPYLVDILTEIRDIDRPILLHVKTVKGKGFAPSEQDPFRFHAPKPSQFKQTLPDEMEVSDCRIEKKTAGKSFTNAFSDAMIDLMRKDEKIVAITAAMPDGTGLDKVAPKFPDRTIDCGLCESHGMDMAAGMAKAGIKPFYAVYSTFSQRALDQTFQEVALQDLPVRICMDRAGYVGGDGAPMHGFMDIAMNKVFPKAVMLAASDEPNLRAGLEFMRRYEDNASLIRYPRDTVPTPVQEDVPPFELGKANLVRPGLSSTPDLAILAYGFTVYTAIDAARQLESQGYDIAVYDARFAKPVDLELVRDLTERGVKLMTIEDHARIGGFGSSVLEACNDHGLPTDHIRRLGHPEQWVRHASRADQLAEVGLDVPGVVRSIRAYLDSGVSLPASPSINSAAAT